MRIRELKVLSGILLWVMTHLGGISKELAGASFRSVDLSSRLPCCASEDKQEAQTGFMHFFPSPIGTILLQAHIYFLIQVIFKTCPLLNIPKHYLGMSPNFIKDTKT